MKGFITGIICCGIIFSAGAQNKSNVQKAYAYVKRSFPGMVRVDEKGKQMAPIMQVERFIYVETKAGQKPVVDKAYYYDNRVYAVKATRIKEQRVEIGKKKTEGTPIIISPKKGNILWQLELSEIEMNGPPNPVERGKQVILKGKTASTKYSIANETEIEPDIRG